jgi:hypothetical protein
MILQGLQIPRRYTVLLSADADGASGVRPKKRQHGQILTNAMLKLMQFGIKWGTPLLTTSRV